MGVENWRFIASFSLCFLLARALHGLSDPYCQSTCMCVYSVSVCFDNFDVKYLGKHNRWVCVQQGSNRIVNTARRLVTSPMTSRDSMTSYWRRHNFQSPGKLLPGSSLWTI